MSKGEIVNRAKLAAIVGVAKTTVDAWVSRGCPYHERPDETNGKQWKFNSSDVFQWLQQESIQNALGEIDNLDAEVAKQRKAKIALQMAELDLAERKGELLPIEEVKKAGSETFSNCRARLLAIPTKLAPIVTGCTDPHQNKKTIEQEINQALNELSRFEYIQEDTGDSSTLDEHT